MEEIDPAMKPSSSKYVVSKRLELKLEALKSTLCTGNIVLHL